MASFKRIKLTPLTPQEKLSIKIRTTQKIDITGVAPDKLTGLFNSLEKIVRKTKGAIMTGSLKGEVPYVFTQIKPANKVIRSFPEPNPVVLYYINANKHLQNASEAKDSFLDIQTPNAPKQFELYCVFLSEVTIGIVSLIMTVEGFINQMLSENATYTINGQEVRKNEIERYDLNRKIREVVPVLTGSDYVGLHATQYQNISLANSKRDDLIHLKKLEGDNFTNYQILFKQLMDLDFVALSDAVFHLVNTVKPDYFLIEEPIQTLENGSCN